ncbi:phospholipase A [bacterium]|nr:phospholipase A [bacterium]MBU1994534.1 phospholipase A [bacterium]
MKKVLLLFLCVLVLFAQNPSDSSDVFTCDINKIQNNETKKHVQNWLDGGFGLKPYKENYILPYGYRDGAYKSYSPESEYKKSEAELQVSLKINVGNNLFGLNEMYYMAYSHLSFWQVYAKSSPFRETNYNPEIFALFPIDDNSDFGLRSVTFGFSHLSNGQGNIEESIDSNTSTIPAELQPYVINRSRSINYLSSTIRFQHDALITDLKIWMPFTANGDLSDNPDIMDYTGFSSIRFRYFHNKHLFTLMGRMNFITANGALETTYSYPLVDDVFLYAKIFSGYGESLIDYNNYITKFAIGFSFSR